MGTYKGPCMCCGALAKSKIPSILCEECTQHLLPDWAESTYEGDEYLVLGAQLCTRDGRRTGNARIDSIADGTATVITDAGNTMRVNASEIAELFYPPKYIMKKEGGDPFALI